MTTPTTPTADDRVRWLRLMMTIRRFEETAVELGNKGQIMGSLHTSVGQEAVCVGGCAGVRPDDYMTGHHRSHGHPIAKGADIRKLMAELMGKATGVCHGNAGSMHLADFSVGSLGESAIVGSSLAIATGAGLASTLTGDDRVCLAFFGDGASNAGIFHESLNMSAVWKLPVVFLCENNQYAVTTRHADVCSVAQIADRAAAYSIPGVVVDGQDVEAVRDAVMAAADRAREGAGPTIVEAMTYRYHGHSARSTTVRDADEVAAWNARDPILLYRERLASDGVLDQGGADALAAAVDEAVADAVVFAQESPDPTYADIVADMYATALSAGEDR